MINIPDDYEFKVEDFFPRDLFSQITDIRINNIDDVMAHAKKRKRRHNLTKDGKLVILSADHPGRRVTTMRDDPIGMGDRYDYLGRVLRVITDKEFDGVMTTTDMIEDILIVDYLYSQKTNESFLDEKVILGCMNRGGHAGSEYEMEDTFTSFSAQSLEKMNMDGGKMLYRLDPSDHGSLITIQQCADAITQLSRLGLYAFVEPMTVEGQEKNYKPKTDLETLVRDSGAGSALGETSLYTWLKLSYNEDFERVARSTTLPILLLGGPAKSSPYETIRSFKQAMQSAPNVKGAMVGRNVTYVQRDDPRAIGMALSKVIHEGYTMKQASEYITEQRGQEMGFFYKLNW
jgi:DhnA family fructose-bisphosphate aldolase class Ia